jgi:tetratricopeptide (TPR) repeat protein
MLDRTGRKDTALWRVLKLSLDTYPDGNPEEELTEILSTDLKFSCEAVIRLIDTLHDLNRDDLIIENFHILCERAVNKALLYFEAAEALQQNEQYVPFAHQLAEELTRQEPFNPDNWVLLAKIEFALDNYTECIAAADYALAIDPENERALLVKGIGMITHKNTRSEGIEHLRHVLAIHPTNSLAVKALAEGYLKDRKKNAAISVYANLMEQLPGEVYPILEILKLHPKNPDTFLDTFAKLGANTGLNERKWIDIAAQLVHEGAVEEAYQMLHYYDSHFHLQDGMEYYLHLMYRTRRYQEYTTLFGECCAASNNNNANVQYDFSANAYLLLASSYLMSKQYDEAKQMCDIMLLDQGPTSSFDEILRWKGVLFTLTFIKNLCNNPAIIPDNSEFDPITFSFPIQ